MGGWESDDDADMDEDDSVVTALGCLGPLGGLLAPELQRYHRHLKGWRNYFLLNFTPPPRKNPQTGALDLTSARSASSRQIPHFLLLPLLIRGKKCNNNKKKSKPGWDLAKKKQKQVSVEMCEIRAALTCFQEKEKSSCVFVF